MIPRPLLPALLLLLLPACSGSSPVAEDAAAADTATAPDPDSGADTAPGTTDALAADADIADADTAEPTPDAASDDVWPPGFWLPSDMSKLYGLWVNDDDGTVRALELAQFDLIDPNMHDQSPVFRLFFYSKPAKTFAPIEYGRATLKLGPLLTLDTIGAEVPADIGKKTELQLLPAPPNTFAVATGSGTPRVYVRASSLP